jgi:hypothetical protein
MLLKKRGLMTRRAAPMSPYPLSISNPRLLILFAPCEVASTIRPALSDGAACGGGDGGGGGGGERPGGPARGGRQQRR